MTSPFISIVVPVYNAEKFLKRCVDSILAQTFTDFELLLVNDGSTDASLQICKEYEVLDNRVVVFDKPNGGVSSARNVGIDNARGEMISFVDADDYLSPDYLEAFDYNGEYDFYSQGAINEYHDRPDKVNIHIYNGLVEKREFLISMFDTGMISTPWAKLYSSKIIKTNNILFDEKHSYAEDRMFNIEYLNRCKRFCLSTEAKYHYTHDNPEALTLKRYPSDKLSDFVEKYRPLLYKLISDVQLPAHILCDARFGHNYLLIQSVLQVVSSSDKSITCKKSFIDSISRGSKHDAATQRKLSILFRLTGIALMLPSSLAVSVIGFLLKLKGVENL